MLGSEFSSSELRFSESRAWLDQRVSLVSIRELAIQFVQGDLAGTSYVCTRRIFTYAFKEAFACHR